MMEKFLDDREAIHCVTADGSMDHSDRNFLVLIIKFSRDSLLMKQLLSLANKSLGRRQLTSWQACECRTGLEWCPYRRIWIAQQAHAKRLLSTSWYPLSPPGTFGAGSSGIQVCLFGSAGLIQGIRMMVSYERCSPALVECVCKPDWAQSV